MRSDKTEELRRRWGLEKKAQREPRERLASIGCKFKSCGSELSSLPSASRKIIKDAIRSVFKDESGGLLSWLSLSHSIAPSNYSPLHLSSFESLWLVIANDGMPGRDGGETGHLWNLPLFSRGRSGAVRNVQCVCRRECLSCSRIGSSGVSNLVTMAMQ